MKEKKRSSLPPNWTHMGYDYHVFRGVRSGTGCTQSSGWGFKIDGKLLWVSQGVSNYDAAHEIAQALIEGKLAVPSMKDDTASIEV